MENDTPAAHSTPAAHRALHTCCTRSMVHVLHTVHLHVEHGTPTPGAWYTCCTQHGAPAAHGAWYTCCTQNILHLLHTEHGTSTAHGCIMAACRTLFCRKMAKAEELLCTKVYKKDFSFDGTFIDQLFNSDKATTMCSSQLQIL